MDREKGKIENRLLNLCAKIEAEEESKKKT